MFRPLQGHHQALLLIVRRPDDGPVRAETCCIPHNKYDVFDVNGSKFILTINIMQ